jgi:hypothetical protein
MVVNHPEGLTPVITKLVLLTAVFNGNAKAVTVVATDKSKCMEINHSPYGNRC